MHLSFLSTCHTLWIHSIIFLDNLATTFIFYLCERVFTVLMMFLYHVLYWKIIPHVILPHIKSSLFIPRECQSICFSFAAEVLCTYDILTALLGNLFIVISFQSLVTKIAFTAWDKDMLHQYNNISCFVLYSFSNNSSQCLLSWQLLNITLFSE